jgi:predicted MPP superfamily phosphohydrolase
MISSILVILALGQVILGIINADNPQIVRWNVTSEKLSKDWNNKKIVIISDLHLGSVRREGFLRKIVDKIEKENPDVVFIVGDLIDGSSFPYEEWFKKLSPLKPQFGILYVEGNHEKYSQEYEKFKSGLPQFLNNLTDKKVIINNTQIIGLDYKTNESGDEINKELESLNYDKNKSSIILMHDPKNIASLSNEGVSLVLSGHTHGGQFFPFTILINILYKNYTHGVFYTGNTASITSYGVGTSLLPIRIGTVPEIVVLTIKGN